MAFPPRGFEISRAQLRVQFNETLEMRAGRWHQHCLEKEENSARPLAASNNRLSQPRIDAEGANDRSWHFCNITRRPSASGVKRWCRKYWPRSESYRTS